MNYKRCVILLFDGARYDVFKNLLYRDRLPNIRRYLVNNGSFLKGYSSLCTTTGPAHIPFIYGIYPGTANVPGIRWFDKANIKTRFFMKTGLRSYVGPGSYYMGHDVSNEYKPLYEYFTKPVGIFSSLDKNHNIKIIGHKRHRIQKALYYIYAHYTHRWGSVDKAACRSVRKHLNRGVDFVFSVFPGIDEITHLNHPLHQKTLEQYQVLDKFVGNMFNDLKNKGEEDTLIFMVSDHGLSQTHTHISLVDLSREEGYNPLYYPRIFKNKYDIAIMESGNAMAFIYFMKPVRDKPAFYDEIISIERNKVFIEKILDQNGIDIIAYRLEKSKICVRNRHGQLEITYKDDGNLSLNPKGFNPLGFNVNKENLSLKDSLSITRKTPYPDSIIQLKQLFNSERTGDIVVFAKLGYDLRDKHEWPEHKSSHGSPLKAHMEVPICTNLNLKSDSCRIVDIFPTVLQQFNRKIPENIDGNAIE